MVSQSGHLRGQVQLKIHRFQIEVHVWVIIKHGNILLTLIFCGLVDGQNSQKLVSNEYQ